MIVTYDGINLISVALILLSIVLSEGAWYIMANKKSEYVADKLYWRTFWALLACLFLIFYLCIFINDVEIV